MNMRALSPHLLTKLFQRKVAKTCSIYDPYKFMIIDYKTDYSFYKHIYNNEKLIGTSIGTYKLFDLGIGGGVLQLKHDKIISKSVNHSDIQLQNELQAKSCKITIGPFYTQSFDNKSIHLPVLNEYIYDEIKQIQVTNFYDRDLFDYRSL